MSDDDLENDELEVGDEDDTEELEAVAEDAPDEGDDGGDDTPAKAAKGKAKFFLHRAMIIQALAPRFSSGLKSPTLRCCPELMFFDLICDQCLNCPKSKSPA